MLGCNLRNTPSIFKEKNKMNIFLKMRSSRTCRLHRPRILQHIHGNIRGIFVEIILVLYGLVSLIHYTRWNDREEINEQTVLKEVSE